MLEVAAFESDFGSILSEAAHSNDPIGLEDLDAGFQMGIACLEEGLRFGGRQFVWGPVSRAFFHKHKRAVVEDELIREEVRGVREALAEKSPQAAPGNF